ncbi:MAG: peptide-methionine (S)-S-oxide reductase MsrA [Kiritimatiellia bacterium]|nr:peptide-methionine (S)-S-oxide reductase MsrA [Kiritimatiellia bacterium]
MNKTWKHKREFRRNRTAAFLAIGAFFVFAGSAPGQADRKGEKGPMETAIFGSGCFWCTEAVYETIPGVRDVVSGYSGGQTEKPTYKQVSRGDTGHAEVVRITFDPQKVGYRELVDLFWKIHDPTSLNRQGADVGTQYRSVIFYQNEEQRQIAEASREEAQTRLDRPIVTELSPAKPFTAAEPEHQDYYRRNPNAGYCRLVIRPKLEKLKVSAQEP